MIENDTARKLTVLVCIWAALLLAPFWMPPLGGYTALGTRVLILGLAAMSVNFLLGFTGVLSFGHAAYFGLGAYGAGLSLKYLAPSTPISLVMGMLLGGLAGAVLGTLIVRRRGVYFAMVTIAFGQVFYYIAFQWSSLTGGDDGLRGFSRQPLDLGFFSIDILSNADNFYFFVLFCFAIIAAVMGFILRSPFGRTMLAIRENERRARFLGIPVERHIWIAFTLSCFFMGFAGALYALLNNFADPKGLALQPVRRLRHDGGDGRHAQLLGTAAWARPSSSFCRTIFRASPSIGCRLSDCCLCSWCCSFPAGFSESFGGSSCHDPAACRKRLQAFRQPGRGRRHIDDGRAGRIARRDRSQRRRQDNVFQHD